MWPRTSKEDYFCNSSQLGAEENSSAGLRMFLRNALKALSSLATLLKLGQKLTICDEPAGHSNLVS